MTTLYELDSDLQALEALLDDQGTDADGEVLGAWLEELQGRTEDKVDRYAAVIRTVEGRSQLRREESRRLADRARADDMSARRLKAVLVSFYERHDLRALETLHYRVTLAAAGGVQALEVDRAPEDLPERYVRRVTAVTLDQDAIRADIDSLPWARLLPRATSIRIK